MVTLGCRVRGDCAAEGVADENEGAGNSNSAHAQDVAREAICGSSTKDAFG